MVMGRPGKLQRISGQNIDTYIGSRFPLRVLFLGGEMRQSSQIYIPIPKARNTKCKVEIGGDDVTSRVVESLWVLPVTRGIGTFSISLSNAKGQISGTYNIGDIIYFYADNSDGSTLQFYGRIDYTKDDISNSGQFLNIEGRHRSFLLNEHLVCHTATNTATSTILKDIIDDLSASYDFTYSNVQTDSTSMSVEWNYKPFWDCVIELCNKAGFDCYVDNDLDFHYFEADSIENNKDAITEGDNFISSKDYGTNDYPEKTRVIVMGEEGGLPLIHTAISPDEGTEIRELFIKDASSNTAQKVKDLAEAKLEEVTNRNPQARILSFGLETLKPGDNIWIIVPRQKIAGQYKIIQINHKFGMKVGGWRTESILEESEEGISGAIQSLAQTSQQITESRNINKFNYSYVWNFNSESGTHSGTRISINPNTGKGYLETTGGATGTWESDLLELDSNLSAVELRMVGSNIASAQLFVSVDGGTVYNSVLSGETTIPTGKDIKIKVVLNSATTQVTGISLLYS